MLLRRWVSDCKKYFYISTASLSEGMTTYDVVFSFLREMFLTLHRQFCLEQPQASLLCTGELLRSFERDSSALPDLETKLLWTEHCTYVGLITHREARNCNHFSNFVSNDFRGNWFWWMLHGKLPYIKDCSIFMKRPIFIIYTFFDLINLLKIVWHELWAITKQIRWYVLPMRRPFPWIIIKIIQQCHSKRIVK